MTWRTMKFWLLSWIFPSPQSWKISFLPSIAEPPNFPLTYWVYLGQEIAKMYQEYIKNCDGIMIAYRAASSGWASANAYPRAVAPKNAANQSAPAPLVSLVMSANITGEYPYGTCHKVRLHVWKKTIFGEKMTFVCIQTPMYDGVNFVSK